MVTPNKVLADSARDWHECALGEIGRARVSVRGISTPSSGLPGRIERIQHTGAGSSFWACKRRSQQRGSAFLEQALPVSSASLLHESCSLPSRPQRQPLPSTVVETRLRNGALAAH